MKPSGAKRIQTAAPLHSCSLRKQAVQAIDPHKISNELVWQPRHDLQQGLVGTVRWHLAHLVWCKDVRQRAGYGGEQIGIQAP